MVQKQYNVMRNVNVATNATYLFWVLLLFISLQRATSTKAFYILFSNQVTDNPEWPTKLCQNNGHAGHKAECVDATQYVNGIFIASPQNMTKDVITKIKKDVSNSKY